MQCSITGNGQSYFGQKSPNRSCSGFNENSHVVHSYRLHNVQTHVPPKPKGVKTITHWVFGGIVTHWQLCYSHTSRPPCGWVRIPYGLSASHHYLFPMCHVRINVTHPAVVGLVQEWCKQYLMDFVLSLKYLLECMGWHVCDTPPPIPKGISQPRAVRIIPLFLNASCICLHIVMMSQVMFNRYCAVTVMYTHEVVSKSKQIK